MKIAAQLYTVRDPLASDFEGTLRRVREIGYTHVELLALENQSAEELKEILKKCELTPVAIHCPIERLHADLDTAIQETRTLGIHYLVCPYLPEELRKNEAGWLNTAKALNSFGEGCHRAGIQFCYHHHSFEYEKVGDRFALDLLFEETDAKKVVAELDTYWIRHGGDDPVGRINRMSGRCPLLHLKDMRDDAERSFGEVGEGILDFSAIIAAAEKAGTVWGIVEQDTCPGDPLESIALSFRNLRKMGYV